MFEPLVHLFLKELILWPEKSLIQFALFKDWESEQSFLLLRWFLVGLLQLLLLLGVRYHPVLRSNDSSNHLLAAVLLLRLLIVVIFIRWPLHVSLDHSRLELEFFKDVGVA